MKHFFFLLLALLAVHGLYAQKVLEGKVVYTYSFESPDGSALDAQAQMIKGMMPDKMTMIYGKGGIITRMSGGMMGQMMGNIVVNVARQEVYMLQESQKVAYVMKQDEADSSAQQKPVKEVVKMDETENILGYPCQKYKMVLDQQGVEVEQYVWVTSEIKLPEYDMPGIEQVNSALAGADRLPGFPMRTRFQLPGLNIGMVMTASELSFEPVDDSLFALPEGYETKDFSELQQQFGGFGGN